MKKRIIGKRISEARRRAGISTSTLAEKIGKSQATISRIENGKQSITLNLLITIARALSIHPYDILGNFLSRHCTAAASGCFAETLKSARIHHNYQISTIARRLKRPESYIRDMENGMILPNKAELSRIASLYNLNMLLLDELYCFEKKAPHLSKHFSELTTILSDYLFPFRISSSASPAQPSHQQSDSIPSPLPTPSKEQINSILLNILSNDTYNNQLPQNEQNNQS